MRPGVNQANRSFLARRPIHAATAGGAHTVSEHPPLGPTGDDHAHDVSVAVALTSFGDAATSRGDFHEGLNIAAVLEVPAVFVAENNGWGYSTPISKQTKVTDLTERLRHTASRRSPSTGTTCSRSTPRSRRRWTPRGPAAARSSSSARPTAWAGMRPTTSTRATCRWRCSPSGRTRIRSSAPRPRSSRSARCPRRGSSIREQVRDEVRAAVEQAEEDGYPTPEEAHLGVFAEEG